MNVHETTSASATATPLTFGTQMEANLVAAELDGAQVDSNAIMRTFGTTMVPLS